MEILRSGKEAYVVECNRCGCVICYGKSEVKYDGPQWDPIASLNCPECHNEIYLPCASYCWLTRKEYENGKN